MNSEDNWTDEETRYFFQLLADERRKGNKMKNVLNRTAKEFIKNKFEEKFGRGYRTWDKFKNKIDSCRRKYKTFERIVHNRTGLGFDEFGRVDMSEDWWAERIKEWPGARQYKNKPLPNFDLYEEEFGAVHVSGAEGWSAQQGESSLDSRVNAENDDEVDSVDTNMAPAPGVGTKKKMGSSGSSGSKRKRKDSDLITETCSARNTILIRKNELMEKMIEREDSCSVDLVLDILNGLPGVRKWSNFHGAAIDHLLANVVNRQGFMAFSTDEDKIRYLEHRTQTLLDD